MIRAVCSILECRVVKKHPFWTNTKYTSSGKNAAKWSKKRPKRNVNGKKPQRHCKRSFDFPLLRKICWHLIMIVICLFFVFFVDEVWFVVIFSCVGFVGMHLNGLSVWRMERKRIKWSEDKYEDVFLFHNILCTSCVIFPIANDDLDRCFIGLHRLTVEWRQNDCIKSHKSQLDKSLRRPLPKEKPLDTHTHKMISNWNLIRFVQ